MERCRLKSNHLSGGIPPDIGKMQELQSLLDLSSNNLVGIIPASIGSLSKLEDLNLSHNALVGTVPSQLARMSSLVELDLSSNRLDGRLGDEFSRWPQDAFSGNAALCGSHLRGCGSGRSTMHSASIALVSAAVTLTIVLLVIVLVLMAVRRRGRHSGEVNCTVFSSTQGNTNRQLIIKGSARREFRWDAIMEATANLSDQFAVGSGGSGTVYRAELPTGETVAVKRFVHMDSDMLLQDKSFAREVKILGRVRHRHLVKLLGFVSQSDHGGSMLIYEYMENGSLYEWLHGGAGEGKKRVLSWDARLKVAAGLVQGVEYLHHDCVPRVVHRDIKSSNVLLDGDMEAHLGDFGLAKAIAENRNGGKECTESASLFAGSYGYMAPECAYSLKATEKSDVYSTGIVLMELVTGLLPTDKTFGGDVDLVRWVQSRVDAPSPARDQLFDPALKPLAPREESSMAEVLEMALRCTRPAPGERPTARQISDLLLHVTLDYYRAGEQKR
ncbi:unnamed protein product [Triticum turgidum subsp. durum]|uniref:non-specific serine/threonine protein kinase n=1 Tax=Triticum turgidum subsp. durum TaxID=4567 RepID=A0A9R1R6B3_TRITD|nr:unnamed protein product [Triticum turgidum subsp. durum]